jgi:hypothetical protein
MFPYNLALYRNAERFEIDNMGMVTTPLSWLNEEWKNGSLRIRQEKTGMAMLTYMESQFMKGLVG